MLRKEIKEKRAKMSAAVSPEHLLLLLLLFLIKKRCSGKAIKDEDPEADVSELKDPLMIMLCCSQLELHSSFIESNLLKIIKHLQRTALMNINLMFNSIILRIQMMVTETQNCFFDCYTPCATGGAVVPTAQRLAGNLEEENLNVVQPHQADG